jgi:hypothetical protein
MHVENRRLNKTIASNSQRKPNPDVPLIRALIRRKAKVAMDTKERLAVRSWISNQERADLVERRSYLLDKA